MVLELMKMKMLFKTRLIATFNELHLLIWQNKYLHKA